jgi:hypothetical protein
MMVYWIGDVTTQVPFSFKRKVSIYPFRWDVSTPETLVAATCAMMIVTFTWWAVCWSERDELGSN